MAFPYIFHSNFEVGGESEWDSGADTASQLNVASYSDLARFPWPTAVPHGGAYCLRANLTGGTSDAYRFEGDINIAAAATRHVRFNMWFSPNFDATADDTVNVFEALASGTVEATFGFRYVAATDVINFGIGETAPTTFSTENIEKGVWYTVEIVIVLDTGTQNNGTIDLYVTRDGKRPTTTVSATQVTGLDQGTVTDGILGVQNHLSTTTGTILFDDFILDDTRIYPETDRHSYTKRLFKTAHAFVGPGRINYVALQGDTATDQQLTIYDADNADGNDATNAVLHLRTTAANQTVQRESADIWVKRGCYVTLSGNAPRAILTFDHTPAHGSDARIRNWGQARGSTSLG